MRITLSVLFYTLIFALLGTLAIAFAFHLLEIGEITTRLNLAYDDIQTRLMTGLSGLLLILLSLSAAQTITGKIQQEKTIAFSNQNGQVTVTLSAVEDLIKRMAGQLSEIKDARADVKASKKGINIQMRITLKTEINIPDFTSKLQDLITHKIEEVFGIEEPISIRIHVAKIIALDEKERKKNEKIIREDESVIPYQNINLS